jgi:proteasome lid subunit RPN8/RPN11
MSSKAKPGHQPTLSIDSEAIRHIRQHARSSSKTEVCGVLIGSENNSLVEVEACIAGVNADEAGAHVTFTQDTWQHIYSIKDRDYPEHRIVGWYHSHPGFGVFLSDHDTFIHKNFFSSPRQVAWVYDPHSDEEGCFGWNGGQIERLAQIRIVDRRGGERVQESGKAEPSFQVDQELDENIQAPRDNSPSEGDSSSLQRLTTMIFSYLSVLLLGWIIAWYFFPRVMVVPVPVDPVTGRPLPGAIIDPGTKENNGQR